MKHTWELRRMPGFEELAKLRGKTPDAHEGYHRENNGDWIISHANGRVAAVTFQGKAKRGEAYYAPDPAGQANAHLIAAAPELLAALKSLCDGEPTQDKWDAARDAIAKAEGRTA